jgi:hypothetical protein
MWDEIIAEVQKHPKLKDKSLPEALMNASGDEWQRDAQRMSALSSLLKENEIDLPAELLPFSERGKLVSWFRRSAGQVARRAKESKE